VYVLMFSLIKFKLDELCKIIHHLASIHKTPSYMSLISSLKRYTMVWWFFCVWSLFVKVLGTTEANILSCGKLSLVHVGPSLPRLVRVFSQFLCFLNYTQLDTAQQIYWSKESQYFCIAVWSKSRRNSTWYPIVGSLKFTVQCSLMKIASYG